MSRLECPTCKSNTQVWGDPPVCHRLGCNNALPLNGEAPLPQENKIDVLLRQAHAIATGPRSQTYARGKTGRNFEFIAELMDAYIKRRMEIMGKDYKYTGTDQAVAMILMKIGRLSEKPNHADSWRDIAGFAACGAQVSDADLSDQPIPSTEKPL